MTTSLPVGNAVGPRLELLSARIDMLAAELAAQRRRTDELEALLATVLPRPDPIFPDPNEPKEA